MRLRLTLLAAALALIACAAVAQGAQGPVVFTLAGSDANGFRGDGGPAATALLNGPAGLAVASDGSVTVADTINQRIRRIDAKGRIRTIAGIAKHGFGGDGGPATKATFEDPSAIALAPDGSLYVADTGNSRLRVISPAGTISTVAGTADQGFSGDGGPASNAQVDAPAGVVVARDGTVFFSDSGNNRIRAIGKDGRIATLAGTGAAGFGGDGGQAAKAQLSAPAGLALAADGSLLIADSANNRVRRVAPDGTISLLAGAGGPRFRGDGGAPAKALLNAPRAVALLPSGFELLIADSDNNRIRYVTIPGAAQFLALAPRALSVAAPLRKLTITVNKRKRRILVVSDVRIPYVVSQSARLEAVLLPKKGGGPAVATLRAKPHAGRNTLGLPARLRRGPQRLTKDHYVVRMTVTAGGQSVTRTLELVVK